MKLVTPAEMRSIEKQANETGLSYEEMMEHAGKGLAEIIISLTEDQEFQLAVLGLAGTGNNGGDTLLALEALAKAGWQAAAYIIGKRPEKDTLVQRFLAAGGTLVFNDQDADFTELDGLLGEAGIVLDGVLGTGLKLPVKPEVAAVLEHVGQFPDLPLVVAVDCPSGVDCETGECAPETIPADFTVCMAAVKTGLLRLPAYQKVGELLAVDIGLSETSGPWRSVHQFVASAHAIQTSLPPRPLDAHKGTFGTALVVAGSINYTGAALLAGKAAYQAGAGLVRMAVPAPLHVALAGHLPEATWIILPHEMGVISSAAADVLLKNLDSANAILLGPGLGMEETTGEFIQKVLSGESARSSRGAMGFITGPKDVVGLEENTSLPPLVVDADGLKLLSRIESWWTLLPGGSVLTPHPGEMAAMTGLTVEQIQGDRSGVAEKYAVEWKCVVVLKGAFTVVAAPSGEVTVIPVATPALARAGTGDVLAGMLAGLLAQGMAAYPAAVAATWLHAQAGLQAEADLGSTIGVMASDVLDALPVVYSRLTGD